MERRWQQLTADVCRPEVRDKWWRVIHDALTGGKHKKYIYNLDYLERRLDLCDQHSQLLARPRAVALAVFFTHLHYDPHCHGIAEESTLSTLAEFAADSQLPAEEVAEVRRLIEAAVANSTPAHLSRDAYGTEDGHFFLDINTAVLGADAGDYGDYAARMRDEYGFMSDADYAQLRLKIPNIFATREFRQRYEGQARENIGREIASLL